MLDIVDLFDDTWGWWEDVLGFCRNSKLLPLLFKSNTASWFIDEIPDTI